MLYKTYSENLTACYVSGLEDMAWDVLGHVIGAISWATLIHAVAKAVTSLTAIVNARSVPQDLYGVAKPSIWPEVIRCVGSVIHLPASVDQTMITPPDPKLYGYFPCCLLGSFHSFPFWSALLIPRHELLLYFSKASTSLAVLPPNYPPDHWNLDPIGSFANSVQWSQGAVKSIRSFWFDEADEGIASRSQRRCHGTWAASQVNSRSDTKAS